MTAESIEQAVRFHRDADPARHVSVLPSVVEEARERIILAALDVTETELRGEFQTVAWWNATYRLRDAAADLRAVTSDEATCTYHGGCGRAVDPDDDDRLCVEHKAGRRWP